MKKMLSLVLAAVLIFTLLPVTARADTGEKLVALTFDDGPNRTLTPKLLDGLKELDVTVTFFMQGCNAENNLSIVQRAYDEGHEVANHTYNHPVLSGQGYSGTQSQVNRTNRILDKVCGTGNKYLLRPPYGDHNSEVRRGAGTALILWSVDTNDWQYRNYSHVYNYIVNNAYDGAIILCHDIHSSTIPAAVDAVRTLKARGYEFVSVSEMFRRKGGTLEAGKVYTEYEEPTLYHKLKAPTVTYQATSKGIFVTLESDDGAPIYYNTDDSRFTPQSTLYTEPFKVDCPVTIHAVAAFNLNGGRSEVTTATVDVLPCEAPKLSVKDGAFIMETATPGAEIYYTLDGSIPTTGSSVKTGTVFAKPDTLLRAMAGGKNFISSQVVSLYVSPLGNVFADVMPGKWYTETMDQLVSEGMIKGLGNDMYGPDVAITRAQLVELLYRYDGQSVEQGAKRTNTFTDVQDKDWFSASVEWAFVNGIVDGYPEGDFRPKNNVTRQEMAKIIAGFLAYRGNELPAGGDCREQFKDGSKIGTWALDYMNAVVGAGLIQGDTVGNVLPGDTATRAQFATILLRMRELEEKMELEREEAEEEETTEPSEPAEPSEPEETMEPSEPAEPSEPEETTEPSETTEPVE